MEIVIELTDEVIAFVEETSFVEDERTLFRQSNADRKKTLILFDIIDAIRNGTPLPKGHGRLIDADALYKSSRLCHTEEDGTACVEWREINDAPTIIEGSDSE